MAFSNTVGTTVVSVSQLVDDASYLCGKKPSDVTAEMVDSVRRQLFYFLMASANLGVNLWTITKTIMGVIPGRREYTLPLGTVDVMNIEYRKFMRPTGDYYTSAGGDADYAFDGDLDTACIQTTADGRIYVDYGANTPHRISVLGFMPYGNATLDLIYEYGDDGVNWNTLSEPGEQAYVDREWTCAEIMSTVNAQFYSVRERGGATLSVREVVFGYQIFDIQLTRQNIDDFQAIPYKDMGSQTPPIWWYNRVLTQPKIQIWPVLNYAFDQIVVYRTRQIMDVGDLTNELEVPDRWLEAVVYNLALRMSMSVFNDVDPNRIAQLKDMTSIATSLASTEEQDLSPSSMGFNLSPYTRG